MKLNDTKGATGTGFIYSRAGKDYLITNWHNVTGRHNETHTPLHKMSLVPNIVTVWYHKQTLGRWRTANLPLYSDAESRHPRWLIHPHFGERVDVVAIPIDSHPAGTKLYPITSRANYTDADIQIASDVFILGFPDGLTGGANLPIWKRGTIASEPDIDLDDLPRLYIDSATRPGMSGSPVIWRSESGTIRTRSGATEFVSGSPTSRIGVYSGRTAATSHEAQIGYVWKDRVIAEIIDGGVLDPVSSVSP